MGNPAEAAPLRRGDVVLVPFPFTDLTGQKVRPALVVSPDPQHDDLIVLFLSSVVPPHAQSTEWILMPNHPEFSATGLKLPSVFKAGKLLTLHRSLIHRRLGSIGRAIQAQVDARILRAVGLAKSNPPS